MRYPLSLILLSLACGASPSRGAAQARDGERGTSPGGARATKASKRPRLAIDRATLDRVKLRWEAAVGGYGRAVAIDRKSDRVAASSGDPIRLYALSSGKSLGQVRGCTSLVKNGLALTERELFVVCSEGLRRYDLATLKSLPAPEVHPERIDAAAILWPHAALGHHDGTIRIYQLETKNTVEIPVPGPPVDVKSLALAPGGARVAVAWVQGSIWWWDTQRPEEPHRLVRHESESDAVAFAVDGTLFAEEGKRSQTTIWAFSETPVVRTEVKNGEWVKRIHFTPDARCLVRGGSDGLEITEIGGPRRVALDTRGQVEDVAIDAGSTALAAIDRDGRLTVWGVQ